MITYFEIITNDYTNVIFLFNIIELLVTIIQILNIKLFQIWVIVTYMHNLTFICIKRRLPFFTPIDRFI